MNIINRIKEKLSKHKRNRCIEKLRLNNPNPRTFKIWEHKSWGDAIYILHVNSNGTFRISGHLLTKLLIGDYIVYYTNSGHVGKGIVSEVEYPGDPWDMFFATVIPICYYEETNNER